jgi:hypothetical protein
MWNLSGATCYIGDVIHGGRQKRAASVDTYRHPLTYLNPFSAHYVPSFRLSISLSGNSKVFAPITLTPNSYKSSMARANSPEALADRIS